jgi:LemA protein
VKEYNTSIKVFPNNIIANLSNFKEKPLFKADAGAEKAPEVFTE